MRQPIWCPSWWFILLAFTRHGVSLTSAWGWKRSVGATHRSSFLATSAASDNTLSLSNSEPLKEVCSSMTANTTSFLHDAGEVVVEDPAEVRMLFPRMISKKTIFEFKVTLCPLRVNFCSTFFSHTCLFVESRSTSSLISVG